MATLQSVVTGQALIYIEGNISPGVLAPGAGYVASYLYSTPQGVFRHVYREIDGHGVYTRRRNKMRYE